MNNRSRFVALTVGLLVLAAAALIAVGAYNAGVAHGIAQSAQVAAGPQAGAPYGYWPRPWGFGFFPVFPLFFFVVFLLFVVRGALWRGPWRGGWGCGYDRAHGEQTSPNSAPRSTT